MALQNNKISESFVLEIVSILTNLDKTGKDIFFEWIPSHCGVNGNEMVDYYAKQALYKDIEIRNGLALSELKTILNERAVNTWQRRWEDSNYF